MISRRHLIFTAVAVILLTLAVVARVVLDRAYAVPPNYSQIEPGLWLGGFVDAPPPGVTAVLNLCETKDPYSAEIHAWEPIRDAEPAPSLEWLKERVAWIDAQRAAKRDVYVHCQQGVSRSGMVVTAFVMRRDGLSRDEALATLRAKRPDVRPHPTFMRLLEEWQAALKN